MATLQISGLSTEENVGVPVVCTGTHFSNNQVFLSGFLKFTPWSPMKGPGAYTSSTVGGFVLLLWGLFAGT